MTTLPDRMTTIAIRQAGGPEVLTPQSRPRPEPAAGEILVKVAAAGVNRPDVMQRMGLYPPPPGATDIPGLEIAGEVVARGSGVTRWKQGDLVMALVIGGGYAEYCLAHESHALPVPQNSVADRGGGHPRNLLHGLAQRFRARSPFCRRNTAGPRRVVRHRHDRDPARQGVRRPCHHDSRIAGKMCGMHHARCRSRRQLQDRGLRRRHQRGDRRPRRRCHPRHDRW